MFQRAYLPLKANRFTSFQQTLRVRNMDLTGVTLLAQVRNSPNDTGTPLATMTSTLTSVVTETDGSKTSTVELSISKATIVTMSADTEDEDVIVAWDLVLTFTDGSSEVLVYGPFVLQAGVGH